MVADIVLGPEDTFCHIYVINLSDKFSVVGRKRKYHAKCEKIELLIEECLNHEYLHDLLLRMHKRKATDKLDNINRVNINTGESIWSLNK